MKMSFLVLFLSLIISTSGYSQDIKWQAGLFSFFDNNEFGRSKVQIPQSMSGVLFLPEVGLRWDSVHSLNVGVDLLHEFGSSRQIDYFYPTAYYKMNKKPFLFLMGAFPRKYAVEKYPRIFFQDSISYYRPNINGILLEHSGKKLQFSLWLDWTGRQAIDTRETFFLGVSGQYKPGILYFRHFSYMFHFSGPMYPVVDEALHDNGLALTSVGLDFSGKTIFNQLDINGGWAVGLDRARADQSGWIIQQGFLMETRIEYKAIGIFNTFYSGRGQMYYYSDHSNELYWGDPFYRAKTYNRSDLYVNFIRNKFVDLRLVYSLHFAENTMFHEQSLKVIFNLNNY
jgi:hypothetical protein